MKITLLSILFLLPFTNVHAEDELYFVDNLKCLGKIDVLPSSMHPDYEGAGFQVTSFFSVRAKDCSLANSTVTGETYANLEKGEKVTFPNDFMGSWFAGPLVKNGNTVSLPYHAWPQLIELTITGQNTIHGEIVDVLEGAAPYGSSYYNYKCTAKVLGKPTKIMNNTKACTEIEGNYY